MKTSHHTVRLRTCSIAAESADDASCHNSARRSAKLSEAPDIASLLFMQFPLLLLHLLLQLLLCVVLLVVLALLPLNILNLEIHNQRYSKLTPSTGEQESGTARSG